VKNIGDVVFLGKADFFLVFGYKQFSKFIGISKLIL